jgi:hypothetical protein
VYFVTEDPLSRPSSFDLFNHPLILNAIVKQNFLIPMCLMVCHVMVKYNVTMFI